MHCCKFVFVELKSISEKLHTKFEELEVIFFVKYRVLDVAHEVFEKCSDNDVDNLDYFHLELVGDCSFDVDLVTHRAGAT